MDLLTLIFRLPFLPVRGFIQLTDLLAQQAEQELRDPANVRRELEEAEEAQSAGELSRRQAERVEQDAINRISGQQELTGDG